MTEKNENNFIPKEPDGLSVRWDLESEEMTLEEMLEHDLIIESVEYLEPTEASPKPEIQ